jgi:hypothetical protein
MSIIDSSSVLYLIDRHTIPLPPQIRFETKRGHLIKKESSQEKNLSEYKTIFLLNSNGLLAHTKISPKDRKSINLPTDAKDNILLQDSKCQYPTKRLRKDQ